MELILIVNPNFCDEIFGAIKTLKVLLPCNGWCAEVVYQDGSSIDL